MTDKPILTREVENGDVVIYNAHNNQGDQLLLRVCGMSIRDEVLRIFEGTVTDCLLIELYKAGCIELKMKTEAAA